METLRALFARQYFLRYEILDEENTVVGFGWEIMYFWPWENTVVYLKQFRRNKLANFGENVKDFQMVEWSRVC